MTKEMAKKMQTPDELNDCNLWPDNRKVSTGFWIGKMPTDYETLIRGDESSSDSTKK